MLQKEIRIYKTEDGKYPFLNWIDSLKDKKTESIIWLRLERVSLVNFGDCKFIGDGIFELRVDFGPGYRVYFGNDGNQLVIILSGGDKDRQNNDIQKAKRYWQDYWRQQIER